ncbi:MAG TPA: 1-acyl-sn-glycerol-3-phosphate acyltransferase [Longimicrobiales bacterium]
MLSSVITRLVGWAAARFYYLDVRGARIPRGPVLVVANHPNALLDPLIIFRVAGRVVRPLAKEPLFHHPLIGPVLKALGGLPVYRKQDHPDLMHQNEQTFAAAVAALHAGDAVQIYPEGQSHSEARVNPLKTGAARIALRAEQEASWQLGLHITPVGLTYARKSFFRGRAVAMIGDSFDVAAFRDAHDSDPTAAVQQLTAHIAQQLAALTLVLTNTEDAVLIDTAERLYAREKGLATWREAEGLGTRLPRMQAFARGLAWLRTHEPARHARLARLVRRYHQQAELLGAREGDVPPKYGFRGVAWYVTREAVMLAVGLPLALLALPVWYPPYALNRAIVQRLHVDETGMATYKLGLAIVLMPLTWLIWVAVGWLWRGPRVALGLAVLLPMLGLVLQQWSGRWEKVKQDSALFLRVVVRPGIGDRLAQQRRELVREFEEVQAYSAAHEAG